MAVQVASNAGRASAVAAGPTAGRGEATAPEGSRSRGTGRAGGIPGRRRRPGRKDGRGGGVAVRRRESGNGRGTRTGPGGGGGGVHLGAAPAGDGDGGHGGGLTPDAPEPERQTGGCPLDQVVVPREIAWARHEAPCSRSATDEVGTATAIGSAALCEACATFPNALSPAVRTPSRSFSRTCSPTSSPVWSTASAGRCGACRKRAADVGAGQVRRRPLSSHGEAAPSPCGGQGCGSRAS